MVRDLVGAWREAAPQGNGQDPRGRDRTPGGTPGRRGPPGRRITGALQTVGDLAHWWLHNVHRQAVRTSSWAKAEDRVRRIKTTLGSLPVSVLDYQAAAEWQAELLKELAPRTVRHHRQTLAQVVDEAMKLGQLPGNPVRTVTPPRVPESSEVALERQETWALLDAVGDHPLAAAVALLSLQGWRVSEVLGLAWEDLDLDAGTATVRRASVYEDGRGQQLGPPKTEGAQGEHWLMPTAVELLRRRQEFQAEQQATAPLWENVTYQGEAIHLVFTTPTGGLVLRQTVAKVVKQAAKTAGLDVDVATHTGRRTVVTTLYVEGAEALDDIARFVGHAKTSTTAGYVKRLGQRPRTVAERARGMLDRQSEAAAGGVRNHPAGSGSDDPSQSDTAANSPDQSAR